MLLGVISLGSLLTGVIVLRKLSLEEIKVFLGVALFMIMPALACSVFMAIALCLVIITVVAGLLLLGVLVTRQQFLKEKENA